MKTADCFKRFLRRKGAVFGTDPRMEKNLPWCARLAVRRAFAKRARMISDSDVLWPVGFDNEERYWYVRLLRFGWDGSERTLPHQIGCAALNAVPGRCTCGITELAEGRLFRACARRLVWRKECFRAMWDRASNPRRSQWDEILFGGSLQPSRLSARWKCLRLLLQLPLAPETAVPESRRAVQIAVDNPPNEQELDAQGWRVLRDPVDS